VRLDRPGAFAERPIRSIRRECLDHVVVFNERNLLRVLALCVDYYQRTQWRRIGNSKSVPRSTGQCKLELSKALEFADELLAAAKDAKEPAMLLTGNHARGTILLQLGELGLRLSTWRRRSPFSTPDNPFPRSWRHKDRFVLQRAGFPFAEWNPD
jgi:hypothetical protein